MNPASPKAEYDLAADLGLATKNELVCRARYALPLHRARDDEGAQELPAVKAAAPFTPLSFAFFYT